MRNIVASGQVTIVDLNDSRQVVSYIGTTQSKNVIFDPNTTTYIPNYSIDNQILQPQIFFAGSQTDIADQATNVKWYYKINGGGNKIEITNDSNYEISSSGVKALKIKGNVLENYTSMVYICEMTLEDSYSDLEIPIAVEVEIVRVSNGRTGADGTDGEDGKDGKGIVEAVVSYQHHTNGAIAPIGDWLSEIPTPIKGVYLWTRTVTTYTDGSSVTTYSTSYYATDGQDGDDGKGIYSTTVRYQLSADGVTTPTGSWLEDLPEPVKGMYLWTRTVIEYTDSTTSTAYSTSYYATDGQKGEKGDDGRDGRNSIVAILSNDNIVIPTDKNGENGIYLNASSTVTVYDGITDVTDEWTVTHHPSEGVFGVADGNKYTVMNLSEDTGIVDFEISKDHFESLNKTLILSKAKQGNDPTAYWLVIDSKVLKKDFDGNYIPETINIATNSKTGEEDVVNYIGSYKIYETYDGVNWGSPVYESANREANIEYTPSEDILALKVQLFSSASSETVLDEEIIQVISDGRSGSNTLMRVWTPEGNIIKNSDGYVKAVAEIFENAEEITPSKYRWYIQDPSATVGDGADADSGNGWRRLTDNYNVGVLGYNTKEITIPSGAITSLESFMCILTYDDINYKDVITVVDVTDPVVVSIIGNSVFKNGLGETELTARLYRDGLEIDANNSSGYTYTWNLYNENNSINSGFGTKYGKTITLEANHINSRANIVCTVRKS